jgi:diguanylate cyclase (GGDEF)-like protein
LNILIIDDIEDDRWTVKTILKSGGYHDLRVAGSARTAIELLCGNLNESNGLKVDLVIMDLIMPDLDGIEACRRIKSIPGLQDLPILMISADGSDENLDKAFEAGAIDFVHKPVNKVELLARVNSILKLKRETDRRKARELELLFTKQQLEKANEVLKHHSIIDDLTGVFNRRYFDLTFKKEWRRAHRRLLPISLILLDIDYFKGYNDTYGHQRGDECLRTIASTLVRSLRRPGDLVARCGGEEFSLILPETNQSGALMVAKNVQKEIAQLNIPYYESQVSECVSASMGVATMIPGQVKYFTILPKRLAYLKSFINSAYKALYEAKDSGRNQIRCSQELEFIQVKN